MKTLKLSMISAAVIAAMGISSAFAAAPADNTIKSTANVVDKCRAVAGQSIGFSEYDAAADSTGSATLSLYCTKNAQIEVSLSGGSQRTLKKDGTSTTDTLNYNLYSDSTHDTVWGGANTVDTAGNGLQTVRELVVYGKIDKNQDQAVAGDYSDTVTVTLTY